MSCSSKVSSAQAPEALEFVWTARFPGQSHQSPEALVVVCFSQAPEALVLVVPHGLLDFTRTRISACTRTSARTLTCSYTSTPADFLHHKNARASCRSYCPIHSGAHGTATNRRSDGDLAASNSTGHHLHLGGRKNERTVARNVFSVKLSQETLSLQRAIAVRACRW